MGKVLNTFTNGWPGAIARSIDDIVIAMANLSDQPIKYGMPVALDPERKGIVPFDGSSHEAADFLGVSVRAPAKTPDAYGSSEGSYAPGDLVDVLVRGHIVVNLTRGIPELGDTVGIEKATGCFASATGQDYVTVPNARFSSVRDSDKMAEIVLLERNIL